MLEGPEHRVAPLPEEVDDALAVQTYLAPAFLPQATACEFVHRGRLEPNVERVVALLKERRDAMLEAFEQELPEGTTWSRPQGGYFTWVDFAEGVDSAALLDTATERGVTFVKGSDFYPQAGGESSARLAFSFVSPAEIRTGVALLAEVLSAAPVAV